MSLLNLCVSKTNFCCNDDRSCQKIWYSGLSRMSIRDELVKIVAGNGHFWFLVGFIVEKFAFSLNDLVDLAHDDEKYNYF